MKKLAPTEIRVGIFALIALLIIAYATVKVSERGLSPGGTYTIYALMTSAEGLTVKTPVEIAGIQVGTIGKAELEDSRRARVSLKIKKGVDITRDVVAQVRTKGFLGETYIDLIQGDPETGYLEPDDTIEATNPYADLSQLTTKLNEIADDVSQMTHSVKSLFADEDGQEAPIRQIMYNLRDFSADLKNFSGQNRDNLNHIVVNLAALTDQMRILVSNNRANIDDTLSHVESIARKIDEGQGTLGKLINDDSTINNLNEAVENLNETLGSYKRWQLDVGYHLEYLGTNSDFKSYIHFALRPRPDRAFMVDLVLDSDPPPIRETVITDVTTGGTTTTVTTNRQSIKRDKLLISAQFAQKYRSFTFRGGIIESTAGIGIDWTKKFFTASFEAFDFNLDNARRPHLKAYGTINVTKNIFLMSGVDDPLNANKPADWFIGAGLRFVDNDVRSLVGLGAAAASP